MTLQRRKKQDMLSKPDSDSAPPSLSLDKADFALDAMPGQELHDILRGYRERSPVTPTRFLTRPAFIITGHAELLDGFRDTQRFPPHRLFPRRLPKRPTETF